jgi:hypothetical protein
MLLRVQYSTIAFGSETRSTQVFNSADRLLSDDSPFWTSNKGRSVIASLFNGKTLLAHYEVGMDSASQLKANQPMVDWNNDVNLKARAILLLG